MAVRSRPVFRGPVGCCDDGDNACDCDECCEAVHGAPARHTPAGSTERFGVRTFQ